MIFLKGRNNLSATIFVPYNCPYNCTFCTSKAWYGTMRLNMIKVLKAIEEINDLDVPEIVISGGEPFAPGKLGDLELILNAISIDKDIYINTVLPSVTNKYEIIKLISKYPNIKGINVSRHGNSFDEDVKFFNNTIWTDGDIEDIPVPVKINHVVSDNTNILDSLIRWSGIENARLSFRADYRFVTKETLKTLDDEFIEGALEYATYISHGGCDVCFDVNMIFDNLFVSYHKGLEFSSVKMGSNYVLVNDIVVTPDGKISYDWDGTDDEINELFEQFRRKSKMVLVNVGCGSKAAVSVPVRKKEAQTSCGSSNPLGTSSGLTGGSCGSTVSCGGTKSSTPVSKPKYTSSCGGSFGCGSW